MFGRKVLAGFGLMCGLALFTPPALALDPQEFCRQLNDKNLQPQAAASKSAQAELKTSADENEALKFKDRSALHDLLRKAEALQHAADDYAGTLSYAKRFQCQSATVLTQMQDAVEDHHAAAKHWTTEARRHLEELAGQ
jgi:hypothetical protein